MVRDTKRLTQLALLTTISLIIFIVELRIPNLLPIPGIKLGLANIITVYALYHYRAYEIFLIVLSRIILGSIFSGNFAAIIFSLSGGMCCLIGILCLRRFIPINYIWLSSICGAVLHNIGQIVVAITIMQTTAILAYLPILLISGIITGAFTGGCAYFIIRRLNRSVSYAKI